MGGRRRSARAGTRHCAGTRADAWRVATHAPEPVRADGHRTGHQSRLVARAGDARDAAPSVAALDVERARPGRPIGHPLPIRPRHRQVQDRSDTRVAAVCAVGGLAVRDAVASRRVSGLRRRADWRVGGSRGGGPLVRRAARRRVRAGVRTASTRTSCRTIGSIRGSGTCRSSISSAPGTFSRRPVRRLPSPSSIRAWPTPQARCSSTRTRSPWMTAAMWDRPAAAGRRTRRSAT